VIYLFAPMIPALLASGVVLRFDLFRALRRPIDGGATIRGRRVFGDSKTWRGVIVAIAGCIFGAAVQKYFVGDRAGALALVDYGGINVFVFGAAMGGGAMLGELPNSLVKRRLAIPPGGTTRGPFAALFYVWDQVDLLTTAWPLLRFWVRPTPRLVVLSVVVTMTIHPISSLIGFLLGARKSAR